ncbi:hypothetical protein TCARB_1756 [Thermofilum adornatum 1505]|uniref:Bacterial repeat domain-containing protein n=1 Tax=Thermofilum adornatum 1505 TaxID=697581 RepID=A0A3G1A715_9CREN|nr:hypothetical protein [Thermofilum adornatum]AJB42792.1 hypothetical protein TCARB_1756 [Thermofilum adornatum 1505]
MQRKTFLVTLVIVAFVASALIYFSLQPKAPSRPTIQPAVNTTQPQQAQNASQPKTKPPTIIATIEASQGGRVLANGTETATWNSSRPFTLLLKAAPDTCYAFDHWEVNGTKHGGPDLALAITGNTTIRAVFYKPLYTVKINANATGIAAQINGENHTLPANISVPACSTVEVKPLETPLYKPLNNTLKITVSSDTNIMLYYRLKVKGVLSTKILVDGKPVSVDAAVEPFENIYMPSIFEVTEDGWMHIRAKSTLIDVYVPWTLTRVVIEVKLVEGSITVTRYCEWNLTIIGYEVPMGPHQPVLEFVGCKPANLNPGVLVGVTSGKRYPFEVPGAVLLSLYSPYGDAEAYVRITAYP